MRILVTGGCGFIGCNAARRFRRRGHQVVVIDNLSRRGARANLEWLLAEGQVEFVPADVRDAAQVRAVVGRYPDAGAVVHLAAQVAVTTSVRDPREDFEINALGTFNVLEAVRAAAPHALVLYASTNKVYGGMEHVRVARGPGATPDENEGRYRYDGRPHGIGEDELLDFHSPYGCSKGAADQYVRDYARIYGMRTVVFRQSCIYGPRQFGIEDQGWVAWFIISAVLGRKIRIYGDGMQVRDMLYVDDLVGAYEAALERAGQMRGRVYNIGGGPAFTRSILGLIHHLERRLGHKLPRQHFDWRPGDQPVYVSDIRKAEAELGWRPAVTPEAGVEKLLAWVADNQDLLRAQLGELLAAAA